MRSFVENDIYQPYHRRTEGIVVKVHRSDTQLFSVYFDAGNHRRNVPLMAKASWTSFIPAGPSRESFEGQFHAWIVIAFRRETAFTRNVAYCWASLYTYSAVVHYFPRRDVVLSGFTLLKKNKLTRGGWELRKVIHFFIYISCSHRRRRRRRWQA